MGELQIERLIKAAKRKDADAFSKLIDTQMQSLYKTAHVDELSYEEESRYKGLEALFKSGQKKPASEIDIIQSPEDYDGTGVAFCDSNNRYYIQKEALSDEDILQIINMRLKEKYVDMRFAEEVKSGKRDAVPVK